ncbi:hypothetical protein AAC387_Pa07g0231 [Persea americana]
MDSIWGGSSVPEISHVLIAIYLAFVFFAARFFLDAFIYRDYECAWAASSLEKAISYDSLDMVVFHDNAFFWAVSEYLKCQRQQS